MSIRLNLFDPDFRENPYPVYARLRAEAPVCRVDPGDVWAVSRYEDVTFVLRNPQLFSSQGLRALTAPPWLDYNPLSSSLVLMDPPQHTKLRNLVNRAFGARALAPLEQLIRARASELVQRLPAGSEIDYIKELALPVPAFALGHLIGIETHLHHRLKQWVSDLSNVDLVPKPEEDMVRIRNTVTELDHYLRNVIRERRAEPRSDMVSDLLVAEVDGQALTDEEVVSFLFMLVVAGLETSVSLLSMVGVTLAEHPALLERLRAEPSLIPNFLEEVMRYDSLVQATARLTMSDVEIAGVSVPKGSLVFALIGSANRDEAQFPQADRFDMERNRSGSLAFGHGPHYCLGSILGKMQARIALESLLSRFGRIAKTRDVVVRNGSAWLRSSPTLWVRLET